jgi:hypothetical protein
MAKGKCQMSNGLRARPPFHLPFAICLLTFSILPLSGCVPKHAAERHVYVGPTETISEVVQAVNQNNRRLPSLWAKGYFEANIVDQGRKHFVNGEVTQLYRQPNELRLVATKDIAGRIFEVGNNRERYWLTVKGDVDTMWWGSYDENGNTAADTRQMPIQPQLLIEVLGVGPIDEDLTRAPFPVMRFNNDADAYMFVWNVRVPDRFVAQREVWYDRQTKLPVKVLLFDPNGRVVLRADLSKHGPVEVEGTPQNEWPKVATNYRLYFPDTGTSMTFELSDLALQRRGAPNDRSFAFPNEPGVGHVVQVDQQANR